MSTEEILQTKMLRRPPGAYRQVPPHGCCDGSVCVFGVVVVLVVVLLWFSGSHLRTSVYSYYRPSSDFQGLVDTSQRILLILLSPKPREVFLGC